MKPRDIGDLLLLAALWGASFLFMRIAAPNFGAVPLAALRVGGAALVLLPLLAWRRSFGPLRARWRPIAWVGLTNSALPFACFAYAAVSISAALSSILNATSPMFGALIAMLWLRESASASRIAGLVIGFAGVVGLAWGQAGPRASADAPAVALAIGLCLAGSMLYGFAANFTKRRLAGIDSLTVAAGSQLSAAAVLALPAWWAWPAAPPSPRDWFAVSMLALLCTALAYLLYFRLIARVGPARAITVTYLVPAFAMLWAALFLGEVVTMQMAAMAVLILVGTGLASGGSKLWQRGPRCT